jgi:hypothetical protein
VLAAAPGAVLVVLTLPLFGLLGLLALQAVLDLIDPYYRAPHPDGMVLRVELGEVTNPIARVTVEPAPGGRPALWIRDPYAGASSRELLEVDYPSGEVRAVEAWEAAGVDVNRALPTLDLDGDGVADELYVEDALVEVRSGATGATLLRDRDPFEYAHPGRAFPLGDLDGDGFDELALVHPRQDRSYDFHPGDALFDATTSVTVVSGARLAR